MQFAQWLYQIKPSINISAGNEEAFRDACLSGHLHVAQWIQSLNPNKYIIVVENNTIINYTIHNNNNKINKSKTIIYKDQIDICPICSETVCELQTSCNHTFCEYCIQTWFNSKQNKICPYCRSCLNNTVFHPIMKHP